MEKRNTINWIKLFLTVLRIAIGWHFLYEGISKLIMPNWTAYSYLANTSGFLSGLYHWLASSTTLIKFVDILNIYGLIIIGIALFVGFFSRIAAIAGTILLTLYYFAYPPFGASLFNLSEGHLFIVDKIFLECSALVFIIFFKEQGYGLDNLVLLIRKNRQNIKSPEPEPDTFSNTRRDVLKNLATLPFLGIMGYLANQSNKKFNMDVMSGATIQLNQTALGELKGVLPKGKIGNHEISRLIIGGNLIGGWAHSRDLIYVSSLFKAYNTEKKIYETLILAEKAGINTINIGFPTNALLAKYKKMTGSKIKVISQVAPDMVKGNYFDQINMAADLGADILQIQGNWGDWLVRDQKTEIVVKMLDKIHSMGFTAGLGAHTIDSLIYYDANNIVPDYYMKTMHHDNYWSAHPVENRIAFEQDGNGSSDHNKYHDNFWCMNPQITAEFVSRSKIPVVGFKVLAAGAIEPKVGFKWAFENGADFICVGMFDFQVVKDVNICVDTLNNLQNRKRELYG